MSGEERVDVRCVDVLGDPARVELEQQRMYGTDWDEVCEVVTASAPWRRRSWSLSLHDPTATRGEAPEPVQPRDGGFLGGLFESLAALSIRVFAQASDAQVHHLRTEKGRREVDFIIESDDGVLGVEVKLASTIDSTDVRHLLWLRDTLGDECIDTLVLRSGPEAYRRPDGVAVVPLALLGP